MRNHLPKKPSVAIVVPARLASQRFPKKLLHNVLGKPIILWTAQRLQQEVADYPLFFAVADPELNQILSAEGFDCIPTDPHLPSGTDRLRAANQEIQADIVINVQADEPLVQRQHITQLHQAITQTGAAMSTLACRFSDEKAFRDPSKVKVVMGAQQQALYFSRAPIPLHRDQTGPLDEAFFKNHPCYWHLGMYAYTKAFLETFAQLAPGQLENEEKLEQLRALEHGYPISLGLVDAPTLGVDTPADAEALTRILQSRSPNKTE